MPSLAQLRAGKSAPQLGFAFEAPTEPEPTPEPSSASTPRLTFSVTELVAAIRANVEGRYANVNVFGEITNCRPASSGHVYFTLKDGEAQIPVVLFRRQAQLLRFKIEDGLEVLVRGKVSIYEQRGQLQLIAEAVEPRGAGALQLAFEQLKARLQAEGLFDADRKRPLPAFPTRIGIVTSPTGAVIRDIVNVVRRRHNCLDLLVYPALVQGNGAATEIAAGIRYFNANASAHRVDLILIARGGGSMEDLSAFNDETVARVIAGSDLPVVSAVGHETDFTIADFVADLRAPTPSAAAELITGAQHRIEERVYELIQRVVRATRYALLQAQQSLNKINAHSLAYRLEDAINRKNQRLDDLIGRVTAEMRFRMQEDGRRLQHLTQRLASQDLTRSLAQSQRKLHHLDTRMLMAHREQLHLLRGRLANSTAGLQSLSPLAVLQRGYALVYNSEGHLLREASTVAAGATITTKLATGAVISTVESIESN